MPSAASQRSSAGGARKSPGRAPTASSTTASGAIATAKEGVTGGVRAYPALFSYRHRTATGGASGRQRRRVSRAGRHHARASAARRSSCARSSPACTRAARGGGRLGSPSVPIAPAASPTNGEHGQRDIPDLEPLMPLPLRAHRSPSGTAGRAPERTRRALRAPGAPFRRLQRSAGLGRGLSDHARRGASARVLDAGTARALYGLDSRMRERRPATTRSRRRERRIASTRRSRSRDDWVGTREQRAAAPRFTCGRDARRSTERVRRRPVGEEAHGLF